jgi:hypothetical protein
MTSENVIIGALIGVIAGFMCYAFLTAVTLPDVWFSYSTGDCVKVLNYAQSDNYSCENLPKRFYHVWVE